MSKTLTLSLKQIYFDEILAGKKKIETRKIRPNNVKRYCEVDKNGEVILDENGLIIPRKYDAITFLTGAYVGTRPRLTIEIKEAKVFILTDEKKQPIEYEWKDGKIYEMAEIDYQLGDIIEMPK